MMNLICCGNSKRRRDSTDGVSSNGSPGAERLPSRVVSRNMSLKPGTSACAGSTINFLLLGTAGSGKSTVFKQFDKMYHADDFSSGKESSLQAIRAFIRVSFTRFTRMLHDYSFNGNDQLVKLSKALQDTDHSIELFEDPSEKLIGLLEQLWSEIKVQLASSLCSEDSDYYFMEKLQFCLKPGYVPSEDDYLRCRVETQVSEKRTYESVQLGKQKCTLTLTDVRGNKDNRRNWFSEEADYVLYIVSLSDYNLNMEEHSNKNRLLDSLETFGEVLERMKELGSLKSIIILLNKQDSFRQKIPVDPLQNHFPKFSPNKEASVMEAQMYIKAMFLQVAKKRGIPSGKIEVKYTSAIDKKFGEKIIHSLLKIAVNQTLT